MSLIKCPECRKEVSSEAPTCPNCGSPIKTSKTSSKGLGCGGTLLLIIIILYVIGHFSHLTDKTTSPESPKPSHTESASNNIKKNYSIPSRYITKGNFFACVEREDFENLTSYIVAKDKQAAMSMLDNIRCIYLKPGIEVQIMDTAIFSGLVQIRPIGSELTLWTNIEATEEVK